MSYSCNISNSALFILFFYPIHSNKNILLKLVFNLQSLERARKLQADLAVEEHRGHELSRILKEILPDPKTPNVPKSRPGRKVGSFWCFGQNSDAFLHNLMTSSSKGTSFPCNNKVEFEVVGSRPTSVFVSYQYTRAHTYT